MQASLLLDERTLAIDALHALTALYTVRPIVEALLDRVDITRAARIIDPSCGDGAFLIPAIERIITTIPINDAAALAERICGWEIHPAASRDARENVIAALVRTGWSAVAADAAARAVVTNRDFLTDFREDGSYDLVLGNPPYAQMTSVPGLLANAYRNVLPAFAAKDLMHAFLARCTDLVSPSGQIVFVTADRWLFNASAAELRARMGKRLGIGHLTRLDASTAFYQPKDRHKGSPPRVHPVEVILEAGGADGRRTLGITPIYPDVDETDVAGGLTLGNVAHVQLAPWLGTPGIFLVDAATAALLPRASLLPAVDAEDFRADGTVAPDRIFAIVTSRDREPDPTVLAHLERHLPRMSARGRRTSGPFWLPPELVTSIPTDRDMLVIPRIAKSLRTHHVPAGIVPVNHNLTIVGYTPQIEAHLNSPASRSWIAARAARLENGYLSITTQLLRRLPVPRSFAHSGPAAA